MQMVSITLRVLSRPDVEHLPKIYQGLGMDYDERVLPSIGNEVLKSIVAQFDAAELITQREVVRSAKNWEFLSSVDFDRVRCRQGFVRISCSVLENSISSLKTSQLRI
jgi:hypothetical protein